MILDTYIIVRARTCSNVLSPSCKIYPSFVSSGHHEVSRCFSSCARWHHRCTLHFPCAGGGRQGNKQLGVCPSDSKLPVQWCVLPHYSYNTLTHSPLFLHAWQATHIANPPPGPVTDVSSTAIRCYPLAPGTSAKTHTVNAGDTLGFTSGSTIGHPGPMQFYLAKVPAGQTAATWDGAGNVWFKIFQEEAIVTSSSISWASMNKAQYPVTLPKTLSAGEYLLRAEHIALHSAGSAGGAQVSPSSPTEPPTPNPPYPRACVCFSSLARH